MQPKLYGAITSSTNPNEIATRIKGITIACSSLIILLVGHFLHIQLGANDIISLGSELGAVGGAIATLYGAGMWCWSRLFKRA